jgi:hypothetical protein
MAVSLDRILGKAFFNDEIIEKSIQRLMHRRPSFKKGRERKSRGKGPLLY